MIKYKIILLTFIAMFSFTLPAAFAGSSLSEASDMCISCHASVTPGIVADWGKGLHARMSPGEAKKSPHL